MRKTLLTMTSLALAATLAACGGSDTAGGTSTGQSSNQTTGSSADSPSTAGVACSYPPDGMQPAKQASPPPQTPTVTGTVPVTISTSVGDIHATLDAAKTPCTVNSFVSLARQKYFDNTPCHRLVTEGIFVLQCGDPSGTGSGGPGYSFADELSGNETYGAGTLAMANAGQDTNGSQFFIVYGDSMLPPSYTVFGHVDAAAVTLVKSVAKKGSDHAYPDGSGHPVVKVDITSVTVG